MPSAGRVSLWRITAEQKRRKMKPAKSYKGESMDKKDVRLAKKKILKCLTEDVRHGGKTSKGIFDKQKGFANYGHTDLQMVMDKVVLGLYLALLDSEEDDPDK
jgi:hypothetical protein